MSRAVISEALVLIGRVVVERISMGDRAGRGLAGAVRIQFANTAACWRWALGRSGQSGLTLNTMILVCGPPPDWRRARTMRNR